MPVANVLPIIDHKKGTTNMDDIIAMYEQCLSRADNDVAEYYRTVLANLKRTKATRTTDHNLTNTNVVRKNEK